METRETKSESCDLCLEMEEVDHELRNVDAFRVCDWLNLNLEENAAFCPITARVLVLPATLTAGNEFSLYSQGMK